METHSLNPLIPSHPFQPSYPFSPFNSFNLLSPLMYRRKKK